LIEDSEIEDWDFFCPDFTYDAQREQDCFVRFYIQLCGWDDARPTFASRRKYALDMS
jgi:hypothetical protein